MFAARWFLTLFTHSLPISAVVRFFDAFVVDVRPPPRPPSELLLSSCKGLCRVVCVCVVMQGFDALFIMTIALLGLLADHIKTLKMDQILRFLHTELERVPAATHHAIAIHVERPRVRI